MKDLLLKFATGIALINSIGQLAGSQIHISAITKIFANEIGFYLFLFIILGLVTAFNIFLLDKKKGIIFFMISSWVTAWTGYIYLKILLADVAAQGILAIAEVDQSRLLVVVSICIYLAGSLVIPVLSWENARSS